MLGVYCKDVIRMVMPGVYKGGPNFCITSLQYILRASPCVSHPYNIYSGHHHAYHILTIYTPGITMRITSLQYILRASPCVSHPYNIYSGHHHAYHILTIYTPGITMRITSLQYHAYHILTIYTPGITCISHPYKIILYSGHHHAYHILTIYTPGITMHITSLQYILRASPCVSHFLLSRFDALQHRIMGVLQTVI